MAGRGAEPCQHSTLLHTVPPARSGGRSGCSGIALEFETDRPSEGLDFDEEGPRAFFQEEDGIEGGSDSGASCAGALVGLGSGRNLHEAAGLRSCAEGARCRRLHG